MQLTSQTTCRDVKHSNPVIGVTLLQLHHGLVRNCRCSSQWSTLRWSFPVNLSLFLKACFVSHFIVLFLNKRDVWNKMAATRFYLWCVCMYNFTSGVNFCWENCFGGNVFLGGHHGKKLQKLEPTKILCHMVYRVKPLLSRPPIKRTLSIMPTLSLVGN